MVVHAPDTHRLLVVARGRNRQVARGRHHALDAALGQGIAHADPPGTPVRRFAERPDFPAHLHQARKGAPGLQQRHGPVHGVPLHDPAEVQGGGRNQGQDRPLGRPGQALQPDAGAGGVQIVGGRRHPFLHRALPQGLQGPHGDVEGAVGLAPHVPGQAQQIVQLGRGNEGIQAAFPVEAPHLGRRVEGVDGRAGQQHLVEGRLHQAGPIGRPPCRQGEPDPRGNADPQRFRSIGPRQARGGGRQKVEGHRNGRRHRQDHDDPDNGHPSATPQRHAENSCVQQRGTGKWGQTPISAQNVDSLGYHDAFSQTRHMEPVPGTPSSSHAKKYRCKFQNKEIGVCPHFQPSRATGSPSTSSRG